MICGVSAAVRTRFHVHGTLLPRADETQLGPWELRPVAPLLPEGSGSFLKEACYTVSSWLGEGQGRPGLGRAPSPAL